MRPHTAMHRITTLRRTLTTAATVVSLAVPLYAQTTTRAEFDVASVRLNTSGNRQEMMVAQPGGRFLAVNAPLLMIIRTAYQLQNDQIVDGPDWLASARVDIDARASESGPPGVQLLERLQSLLEQRFMLRAHREQRERPVYALVRANSNAALGPGLRPTACPDLPEDLARQRPCANISTGNGRMTLRGMPLDQFLPFLAPQVSRVVVDRTALAGRYDIELAWTPDMPASNGIDASADPNGVSIFTAVQEQLGLRLEPARAPVDVLVIEHIEQPGPN